MDFLQCFQQCDTLMMEGALGERLKREFFLQFDPHVAMARLVCSEEGSAALRNLWRGYREVADRFGFPFLATTPTRRANLERMRRGGFSAETIGENLRFLRSVQKERPTPMFVGGLMGCKGDAYTGEGALSVREARRFHAWQAEKFAVAGADFLMAAIMPTLSESIGMAQALSDVGTPYLISFTIQADGRLIDGTSISEAIETIDRETIHPPVCYMTNCVHPRIVFSALTQKCNQTDWVQERFLGIQANTSPLSYAELDRSEELKCSSPEILAEEMVRLREISRIKLFGGCCGTDVTHLEAIGRKLAGE